MNNNRNNSNNNKMNINFLNGKTCNSNCVGVKKFSYGFNYLLMEIIIIFKIINIIIQI